MNWRRILSIIRKEWWHITRDKTSFGLLLLSPALALVTMAYAFSIDITDVGIGVLNRDLSPLSRGYISQLGSTDALRLEAWPAQLEEVEALMMRGQVKAVVIIPAGFERDLLAGRTAGVQVVVDGTDPNTAGHAIRHVSGHTEHFVKDQVAQQLIRAGWPADLDDPIDLRLRSWFNPSLRYTVSMIPALVGIVLSVPAMAASLALAREREWGTLEGLIATPIGRVELIVGKLIPYVMAGFLSVPLCVAVAVFGFNVPLNGSLALFLVLALVFLFATMSIALFLSVFAGSQQVAILGSMIIFLFSGFFMSGLLIPFSLMGPILKLEAFMFPTTHFVIISRGIFVKGAGLAALQGFVLALLGLGAIFFTLTVLMFKKKL
ncbi:MAG TPA: ABC transporter permease [Anaerolineae bacterium]|jgi:ABC-2 type transport system permease protein|nr:ABC transporter permease [Anaerolineae bacterium]